MEILMRVRDKKGDIIDIINCDPSFRNQVIKLFREGYPDSFDECDLVQIERDLIQGSPCLLARKKKLLVGAVQFTKWPAIQDGWLLSYFFVREKGRGIGEILCAVIEEFLKKKARIIFTTHAGILPNYVSSYGFFPKIGYQEWGVLPGYFRDDLWGIFFVKRNPYYPIGKGIPRNSGWCKEIVDERSGKHISREEYQQIKHGLELTPKEKWGLSFIKQEDIIECHI